MVASGKKTLGHSRSRDQNLQWVWRLIQNGSQAEAVRGFGNKMIDQGRIIKKAKCMGCEGMHCHLTCLYLWMKTCWPIRSMKEWIFKFCMSQSAIVLDCCVPGSSLLLLPYWETRRWGGRGWFHSRTCLAFAQIKSVPFTKYTWMGLRFANGRQPLYPYF